MIYCSTAEEVNSALEANPNASIEIIAKDGSDLLIYVEGSPTLRVRSGVAGIITHKKAEPRIHIYQDITVTTYDDSKPHITQHDEAVVTLIEGVSAAGD